MASDPFQHAMQLLNSGQVAEARQALRALLEANPRHVPAWMRFAETCKTREKRIHVLETAARFNPESVEIRQQLEKVMAQPAPALVTQTSPLQPAAQEKTSLPLAAENRTGKSAGRGIPKLLWAVVGLLVIVLVILLINNLRPGASGPSAYRHDEPSEYYLYVPSAYQPGQAWPLFIGIHGEGGSGLDCWQMWQQYADQEQFILLCPSLASPDGGWYQADGERKLFTVLDEVTQTLQIEPVYFLAGFSAGAQFVQGVAFSRPDNVTGTAVLSAGNYMPLETSAQAVPFQVIIGDADNPEAVAASQQFVTALQDNQFSVEYYVLPGVGHEVTDEARQLTIDFFRWVYGK